MYQTVKYKVPLGSEMNAFKSIRSIYRDMFIKMLLKNLIKIING